MLQMAWNDSSDAQPRAQCCTGNLRKWKDKTPAAADTEDATWRMGTGPVGSNHEAFRWFLGQVPCTAAVRQEMLR